MIPAGWQCPRRIGFLFPHPCGRLTPIGCPDCDNGQVDDPYARRSDRDEYTDYDSYDDTVLDDAAAYQATDFTEADGENLVRPEEEFEDDMTES
jgi:hypothetical protein